MAGVGFGDTFENDLLKLIFNGTAIANIADNAASAPLTDLYVSLHTADPDDNGTQETNEISYTGYARVAVARSVAGWTVTGNSVSPAANIDFTISSGGTGGTATYAVIGTAASGAGKILGICTLSPTIAVASGVTPRLTTASTFTLS